MQSVRRREVVLLGGVLILMIFVGAANLRASKHASAALVCASNMRTLMRGATVYATDHALAGASLDVRALAAAGLVTQRVGRCPLGRGAGPDYVVTLQDGRPVSILCTVDPAEHRWTPPPDHP